MLSTLGAILTVAGALLSSLAMLILWLCWRAERARRASTRASASTAPEKAPEKWESRLREVEGDLASLSLEFEKVLAALKRHNSRAAMRESRSAADSPDIESLPRQERKVAVLRQLGLAGKVGPAFAQRQLDIERGS